jgi:hypothetical protein
LFFIVPMQQFTYRRKQKASAVHYGGGFLLSEKGRW